MNKRDKLKLEERERLTKESDKLRRDRKKIKTGTKEYKVISAKIKKIEYQLEGVEDVNVKKVSSEIVKLSQEKAVELNFKSAQEYYKNLLTKSVSK